MKKIRTTTMSILIAFILLMSTTLTAFAASPVDVHIVVDELTSGLGVDEPFTASGSAVDAGLICATGMVQDVSVSTSGAPTAPYRIIQVVKHFTCDDGTFDVSMLVRLDLATHYTTASWHVVSGTGAYASLGGRGTLAGTPIVSGTSIQDVYDGALH